MDNDEKSIGAWAIFEGESIAEYASARMLIFTEEKMAEQHLQACARGAVVWPVNITVNLTPKER